MLAEEAGITLIQLAVAFVLNHPAITSAILGPRTMEHLDSQLAAADVSLSQDVLDRIDEIVAPGTTVNPVDNSFTNPALEPAVAPALMAARRDRQAFDLECFGIGR